jgi:hypothetical protein
MKTKSISDLNNFLSKLEKAHIYFEIARIRYDAIMVIVRVPGEIWEIEFMNDGTLDVEIFKSKVLHVSVWIGFLKAPLILMKKYSRSRNPKETLLMTLILLLIPSRKPVWIGKRQWAMMPGR